MLSGEHVRWSNKGAAGTVIANSTRETFSSAEEQRYAARSVSSHYQFPKVPLKIGIFEDLVVPASEFSLSESELRAAIKIWCRGSRYWTSLVEGAVRVDLLGLDAGRVSKEDGARALKMEESRLARAASKAANVEKIV